MLDIIERLRNNEFISDIASDYNVSTSTIHDIRRHKTWKHLTEDVNFDSIRGRKRSHSRPVSQYDTQMNFLATYKSAREAETKTGVGYKMISQICHGQRKSAHGYIFTFA